MNAAMKNHALATVMAWIEDPTTSLGHQPQSKDEAIQMWLDGLDAADYAQRSRDFMHTNTQAREAFSDYVEAAYDLEHPSTEGE